MKGNRKKTAVKQTARKNLYARNGLGSYQIWQELPTPSSYRKGFFTGGEEPLSKVSAGTGLPATAVRAIPEISKIPKHKLKLVLRHHHLQTSKKTLCLRPF